MGKTQFYTATSIDGYIADAKNSLDWLFESGTPDEPHQHGEYDGVDEKLQTPHARDVAHDDRCGEPSGDELQGQQDETWQHSFPPP